MKNNYFKAVTRIWPKVPSSRIINSLFLSSCFLFGFHVTALVLILQKERNERREEARERQADTKDLTSSSKVLRVLGPNLTDAAFECSFVINYLSFGYLFKAAMLVHGIIPVSKKMNSQTIKEKERKWDLFEIRKEYERIILWMRFPSKRENAGELSNESQGQRCEGLSCSDSLFYFYLSLRYPSKGNVGS